MGLLSWLLRFPGSISDLAQAISLVERVVALRTEVLGPDDPKTIDGMNNLGGALEAQCQYEKSETLHREALARSTRVCGRHHLDTLNCMSRLPSVLSEQHDAEKNVESIALLREG